MDKRKVISYIEQMIEEKEHDWVRNFVARELNSDLLSSDELTKDKESETKKNIDSATFNIASIEKDIDRLKRFLKIQKG